MIEINDKNVIEFNKRQAIRDTVCDFLVSKNLFVISSRFSGNDFYVHKNTVFNKFKAFIGHPRMRDDSTCLFYITFGEEPVAYGLKEMIITATIDSTNSSKKTLELINEISKHLDEKGWRVIVTLRKDKYTTCKLKKK